MAKIQRQSGVQSIEVGFPLVDALAEQSRPVSLSVLAATANMSPSKAHKYLVSLMRVGLVEQDTGSGKYDLGPAALKLGMGALRRLDVIAISSATMARLSDELEQSTVLCVWSDDGPTVVAWQDSRRPITVNVRVGSRLPLLTSANGRVFLAWLPSEVTRRIVLSELGTAAARAAGVANEKSVQDLGNHVRESGAAEALGTMMPGVTSVSCPIFDSNRSLVATLAVVATQEALERRNLQDLVDTLKSAGRSISARMAGRTET
jgi:DNA-binding IclR family transcriptional regulator